MKKFERHPRTTESSERRPSDTAATAAVSVREAEGRRLVADEFATNLVRKVLYAHDVYIE
jgi:hypothetical protein